MRLAESALGNGPMGLVLRLTSRKARSKMFVVLIFFHISSGKGGDPEQKELAGDGVHVPAAALVTVEKGEGGGTMRIKGGVLF